MGCCPSRHYISPPPKEQVVEVARPEENGDDPEPDSIPPFIEYSLEELIAATNYFNSDKIVSESGEKAPNIVYKGRMDNNRWIAVKKFSKVAGPDAKQFVEEAWGVGWLRHERLVNLIGYCCEGDERILVAEYMPNDTLVKHLFHWKNRPHLSLMLKLSVAGIVIVAVVLLTGLVIIWKGKYKKQLVLGNYKPLSEQSRAISKSKLNYKFQTLQIATKKFNSTNKIGQGGFGSVYKGVLLDGREIAVKRLFAKKEQSQKEFFNEVHLISRIQHKNLLNLLGCSVDGPDKLLVYEYLPNKSLDCFLDDENKAKLLDWPRRFEIILGTARGLAYLHEESDTRIIHRDIKAGNILLDQIFRPKIGDFGLVRHFGEDQTHLSTAIVGTRGYMAPEYVMESQLTEKVDVFAFGMLVLQIISGRKNIMPMHANQPHLLTVIWKHYLSGTISNIMDPNIEENYQDEVFQIVKVALLCTQDSARLRPSMSSVIMFLTSKDPNIPAATKPRFIDDSDSDSNTDANQSESNSNTAVGAALGLYNSVVLNIASSPATVATISTNSFGPR